jgi:hypothetical protein
MIVVALYLADKAISGLWRFLGLESVVIRAIWDYSRRRPKKRRGTTMAEGDGS